MRTIIVTLLLLVPVLAPGVGATEAPEKEIPPMPDDYIALAEDWIQALRDESESFDAELRRNVTAALDRADAYLADGRFRSAVSSIMHAHNLIAFADIWPEIEALNGESARRTRLIEYGDTEYERAQARFATFRARLNELDGSLTSIRAMESALYVADTAMGGVGAMGSYPSFRKQIQASQQEVVPGLVRGILNTGPSASVLFGMTTEMLDLAEAREGVKPRADAEAFRNFTARVRVPMEDDVEMHLRPYAKILDDTMDTDEDLLAFSAWSAFKRANGLFMEQFRFGDAADRGVDAVRDLHENVNRTLAEPILDSFESRGFEGLLARDAIDFTWSVKDGTRRDVGTFARAWIDLYHANATASYYGLWSPVGPEFDGGFGGDEDPEIGTTGEDDEPAGSVIPGPGVVGVLALTAGAIIGGFAWYSRRR